MTLVTWDALFMLTLLAIAYSMVRPLERLSALVIATFLTLAAFCTQSSILVSLQAGPGDGPSRTTIIVLVGFMALCWVAIRRVFKDLVSIRAGIDPFMQSELDSAISTDFTGTPATVSVPAAGVQEVLRRWKDAREGGTTQDRG